MADNKDWYKRNEELHGELNAAAIERMHAFMRWGDEARGPIPEAQDVDTLQHAFNQHVDQAPDDEPDDEEEVLERSQKLAKEHRDSMGPARGYSPSLSHTQTQQYHDDLTEDRGLQLGRSIVGNRLMPVARTPVLPRRDAASAAASRQRMAAALAAYQEAHPDEDISITAADRERLLGRVSEGNHDTSPADTPMEPVEYVAESDKENDAPSSDATVDAEDTS